MFPIILITGQVFNKNETWKNTWKEGGILGLAALSVSLSTTIWIVYDYLIGHADITNSGVDSWLEWISFDVLQTKVDISENKNNINTLKGLNYATFSLTLITALICSGVAISYLSNRK